MLNFVVDGGLIMNGIVENIGDGLRYWPKQNNQCLAIGESGLFEYNL